MNEEHNTEEYIEDEEQVEEELDESTKEADESDDSEDSEEEDDSKKTRANNQIARLKKQLKEEKEKNAKLAQTGDNKQVSENDALLARLESRGVMDSKEQDYVIRFAKAEGISPIEALSDEIVKDKLNYFRKQKEVKASTFKGTNRTGGKTDDVEKWVARFKKDGSLPDNNPALTSKILDRLK